MYKILIITCLSIISGCGKKEEASGLQNQVTDTMCISGMICDGCTQTIGKKLKDQEGVLAQKVILNDSIAVITYDRTLTDLKKIKQVVKDAGYEVKCIR